MINTNFLYANVVEMVGRLLPAWARGRKINALLQAILSPLQSAHYTFVVWATEKYIFAHTTAQGPSLAWYMKYKLKSHFDNPSDDFSFVSGLSQSVPCFGSDVWRNNLYWRNDRRWDVDISEGHTDFELENASNILVYAPKLKNDPNYDQEDYKRDIMLILSQFSISFRKIIITINS